MTEISVIVPAYNAAETIDDCLDALRAQSVAADRCEIIVVDDGSRDGTAELAEAAGVRVIRQANAGAAAARNHGAQVAQGDLLLFTDADCVPTFNWIEQMSRPFADPKTAGAKGVYLTRQKELTARFVQLEYEDKYDRMRRSEQIDFIDTYSAAYRREIFLAMGGFDTSFPGASVEDQEFSFRLATAGLRLVFVPEAKVWHRHDRTVSEYARRKFAIGFWKPLVMRRYPDKLKEDSHTPQVVKVQMALAALGGGLLGLGWLFGLKSHLLGRWFARLGWLSWGLLLFSGQSFSQKVARQDPPVLVIVWLMLFVRAWALGLGFLLGGLRLLVAGRSQHRSA